jgi:hypothetical protein
MGSKNSSLTEEVQKVRLLEDKFEPAFCPCVTRLNNGTLMNMDMTFLLKLPTGELYAFVRHPTVSP